jgi:hypothetical protein
MALRNRLRAAAVVPVLAVLVLIATLGTEPGTVVLVIVRLW